MAVSELIKKQLLEECPCGARKGCPHCGGDGYRPHSHVEKAEQFTKPGTANVSAADLKKLQPLIAHYRGKPHPFKSCFRDQVKHGLSPGHAARRCAVLKDLMMGTTSWRKGGVKKLADLDGFERLEFEEGFEKAVTFATERDFDDAVADWLREIAPASVRDGMFKASGRGSNPRWPKGTPGIGGQWRPDGMPDNVASLAAKVLGQLDDSDPDQKQLAKDFNANANHHDWKNDRAPIASVKGLLEENVLEPLKGRRVGGTNRRSRQTDIAVERDKIDARVARGDLTPAQGDRLLRDLYASQRARPNQPRRGPVTIEGMRAANRFPAVGSSPRGAERQRAITEQYTGQDMTPASVREGAKKLDVKPRELLRLAVNTGWITSDDANRVIREMNAERRARRTASGGGPKIGKKVVRNMTVERLLSIVNSRHARPEDQSKAYAELERRRRGRPTL